MKNRLRSSASLVFMGLVFPTTFAKESVYKLRSRASAIHRHLQEPLSFSGDLDPIIDAAQELADLEKAQNGPTKIGCALKDTDNVVYLDFRYEMETLSPSVPVDDRDVILQDEIDVQALLEADLNAALADKLLNCPRDDANAGDNTGIVAFDSAPTDEEDTDATCGELIDSENTCKVLKGEMLVWYTEASDKDLIEYIVRTSTRDYLNNGDPNVPGIARTKYLGPPITNPNGATDGGEEPSDEVAADDADSGLTNRSIIIMSVASVGFVAAVGMITYFRMRKTPPEDEVPYVATLENESSGEESPSRLSSSNDDESNFSSIMPSNYRFDISESPFNSIASPSLGTGSMGTIHESNDDGQSDGQRSDDILVSDGYTTEGDSSTEFPYYGNNYVANAAPVLGARPRTEEEVEESLDSAGF